MQPSRFLKIVSSSIIFITLLITAMPVMALSIIEFPIPTASSNPYFIVTGPDGNLWFAEAGGNKIGKITTAGIITEYVVPTAGSSPVGITVGPDGNLWFTEYLGNKIGKVTTTGSFTEYTIPTAGSQPLGITTGPDGNLWFTNTSSGNIGKITTTGTITEYAIGASTPFSIVTGPDGNLWFTEYGNNSIGKITTAGVFTEYPIPTAGSGPIDITVGPDDNLWFTEYSGNKIGKLTTAGNFTEYTVPTAGAAPYGIAKGSDGNLWFAEYTGNKIGMLTTAGVFTEFVSPTANSFPYYITSGPDGNIWFGEYSGNKIAKLALDTTPPLVALTSLTSTMNPGVSSFAISFSENVENPSGNSGANDVTNPANYLLVNKGANGAVNTVSCLGGIVTDDTKVAISSVAYNSTTFTATINLASTLPAGSYRLFVCGTTSIVDLTFNRLGGGVDYTFDFTVTTTATASSLPDTGFAPNRITSLAPQPANLAYASMSDIWLEIPALNIKTNIVGVPKANNTWDVSWLGNDTGWLNGTAFPSWEGNSVLTAHVTNSNGLPGPFANIKNLKYGNQIIIHIYGEKYIFEVRNTRMVRPNTTQFAFQHLEDHSYLTLITCQGYNPISDSYLFRRVIRAVLVDVQ